MEYIHTLTIERGEDIRKKICDFVVENQWEEAIILGAIGSVEGMIFNAPISNDFPVKLSETSIPYAGEILSFAGEVMNKDLMAPGLRAAYPEDGLSLFVHVHASIAIAGANVCGGGLKTGKAFRALRVFITPNVSNH